MKHTGIIRKVDHLGRIVLPKELRNSLHLQANTPMEISVDGDTILLRKCSGEYTCVFCGQEDPDGRILSGQCICRSCLDKLRLM